MLAVQVSGGAPGCADLTRSNGTCLCYVGITRGRWVFACVILLSPRGSERPTARIGSAIGESPGAIEPAFSAFVWQRQSRALKQPTCKEACRHRCVVHGSRVWPLQWNQRGQSVAAGLQAAFAACYRSLRRHKAARAAQARARERGARRSADKVLRGGYLGSRGGCRPHGQAWRQHGKSILASTGHGSSQRSEFAYLVSSVKRAQVRLISLLLSRGFSNSSMQTASLGNQMCS